MSTPTFLIRLMNHRALSRSFNLGPEDREAYGFANDLRAATLEGRLRAVFCHVPNELAGIVRVTKQGRRPLPQAALAKALGLITGAADYLFCWSGGSCAMEFKSATGRLTEPQRDFRSWCEATGVPFHIIRSSAEGLYLLRTYGVLT